jgi:hypothetical protein
LGRTHKEKKMRADRWTAIVLALCGAVVPSCGGKSPTDPSSTGAFPVAVNVGGSCGSAIFFVTGFSSRVTDPGASPPLEARVRVGERVKVGLQLQGCGYHNQEVWSSQDSAVGMVMQDFTYSFVAEFVAVAPGTTTVFVDFTAMDDKRHRTTIGYCALDAQYPGLPSLGPCGNPKLIGTVRVVE